MLQYNATTLVKYCNAIGAVSKCAQTVAEFEIGSRCRELGFDVCEILSLPHFVDPPHHSLQKKYCVCLALFHTTPICDRTVEFQIPFHGVVARPYPVVFAWHRKSELSVCSILISVSVFVFVVVSMSVFSV